MQRIARAVFCAGYLFAGDCSLSAAGDWYAESITFVAEVPEERQAGMEEVLGPGIRTGFYSRTFLHLWSWSGEFVLYHNEVRQEYVELQDEDWDLLLGDQPENVYPTPVLYRYPPGLIILAFYLAYRLFGTLFGRPNRQQEVSVSELRQDPSYQEAMTRYRESAGNACLPSEQSRAALMAAVAYLRDECGADEVTAGRDMLILLGDQCQTEVATLRTEGGTREHAGDYEAAADCYRRAAVLVEYWDPDDAKFLKKCVHRAESRM